MFDFVQDISTINHIYLQVYIIQHVFSKENETWNLLSILKIKFHAFLTKLCATLFVLMLY